MPEKVTTERVSSGIGHGYSYDVDQIDFEAARARQKAEEAATAVQAASRPLGAMIGANTFQPVMPAENHATQAVNDSFNR